MAHGRCGVGQQRQAPVCLTASRLVGEQGQEKQVWLMRAVYVMWARQQQRNY